MIKFIGDFKKLKGLGFEYLCKNRRLYSWMSETYSSHGMHIYIKGRYVSMFNNDSSVKDKIMFNYIKDNMETDFKPTFEGENILFLLLDNLEGKVIPNDYNIRRNNDYTRYNEIQLDIREIDLIKLLIKNNMIECN